jgi:hypothetical protein
MSSVKALHPRPIWSVSTRACSSRPPAPACCTPGSSPTTRLSRSLERQSLTPRRRRTPTLRTSVKHPWPRGHDRRRPAHYLSATHRTWDPQKATLHTCRSARSERRRPHEGFMAPRRVSTRSLRTSLPRTRSEPWTVLMPMTDMFFGIREGRVSDPFGNVWTIATLKDRLSPEELLLALSDDSSRFPS